MAPSANSDPDLPPAARRQAGFSLVEVALALGIVAFALIPVFSLLPIGMSSFKRGMDLSVGAQITQRIVDEAQQSDFDTLTGNKQSPFAAPIRFFSAQGEEQALGDAGIIYRVNTRIAPLTYLPGSAGTDDGVVNPNIATVTVQVANNPGNRAVASDNSGLWVSTQSMPLTTASTYVARNSALTQ